MPSTLRTALLLSCVVLCACASRPRSGDPGPGWVFLDERKYVDHQRSRKWQVGARMGEFTHILVRVRKLGFKLNLMRVTFANGEKWEPSTPGLIAATHWSKIKIKGGARKISNILIKGASIGFETECFVRVYVLPDDEAAGDGF